MSDNNLLRRLLIDEEGCKLEAHIVKEKWHIGIGHLLSGPQSDEELAVLGEYDEDEPSVLVLSEQQAYTLFDIDVADAIEDVYPSFTEDELDQLGETRRAIILSMTFQMGGVRKYKNFIKAVKEGDFELAANEMITGSKGGPSLWYKQTPERCQRATDAMRAGYFAQYEEVDEQNVAVQGESGLSVFTDKELLAELQKRLDAKTG